MSLSKNFFSRHLSPDKTRKSHLDFPAVIDADPDFIGSPNLDYVFKPHQNVNGGSGENARAMGSMYIEVLKYSTLLERAQLRNKAFVEPLFENVLENPVEDIG